MTNDLERVTRIATELGLLPEGELPKEPVERFIDYQDLQEQLLAFEQAVLVKRDEEMVGFQCKYDLMKQAAEVNALAVESLQAKLAMQAEALNKPTQPLAHDEHGTLRFKQNAIVNYLYEYSLAKGCGLNELARMEFTDEDRQQFAQLIGYSLSGYGELSNYVDDAEWERVNNLNATQADVDAFMAKKKAEWEKAILAKHDVCRFE